MKNNNNFIMGRNTLEEILKYKPEILLTVYVNSQEQSKQRKNHLIQQLLQKKIELQYVSKKVLFSLVESESHQSFVAQIKPRFFLELDSFLKKNQERSFVIMLDSIYDPQNMGAILRSCECFKVDAVVFSKNRGTDITPVVSKASCGASEFLSLIKVSNLVNTAQQFKKADYEVVIAENTQEAKDLFHYSFPKKTLLIVGSEGEGIQPLLKKQANEAIKIPLFGKINSLNVAQASSIILAFMKKEQET